MTPTAPNAPASQVTVDPERPRPPTHAERANPILQLPAMHRLRALDPDVQAYFPDVPIITCRSADKRDHAKPGDVLIDDWPQHRHRWIEMGGVFISHYDAESSLAALWAHCPALRP